MALEWTDKVGGVDYVLADDINSIAHAVIDLEEIDTEMSDTSNNAVQNKVIKNYIDESIGDIETALDSIIAIQNSLIGGDSV